MRSSFSFFVVALLLSADSLTEIYGAALSHVCMDMAVVVVPVCVSPLSLPVLVSSVLSLHLHDGAAGLLLMAKCCRVVCLSVCLLVKRRIHFVHVMKASRLWLYFSF
mmetsp:Transcript_14327/g.28794  ORF Transcript_14327/g.28794 Transcript_14327/m.28794 type:complete len:107 (+) Transcript_14327:979-1299(+)